jgi:chemotaxis signal transduction protein
MDLSVLFEMSADRSANSWLLICGKGDEAVGIAIDSLPERKSFVQEDEIGLSEVEHPIASYAKAAYRDGQDIWIDIDTNEFFGKVFHVETDSV